MSNMMLCCFCENILCGNFALLKKDIIIKKLMYELHCCKFYKSFSSLNYVGSTLTSLLLMLCGKNNFYTIIKDNYICRNTI